MIWRAAGRPVVLLALGLAGVLPAPGARAAGPAAGDVVLGECLVLRPVGRYGRAALHLDALEAEVVAGHWKAPRAGDAVRAPDGTARAWEKAAAGKDGELRHEAFGGGYAYWSVSVDRPCVRLLEASGHSMAYVGGEPRAGDPYGYGTVRLPVRLHAGTNDFLFHCGRGRLQARLTDPGAGVLLDARDATLPDYVVGGDDDLPWAAVVVVNATDRPLDALALRARAGGREARTPLPAVPPLATRKVGFRLPSRPEGAGEAVPVGLTLFDTAGGADRELAAADLNVRVRRPGQSRKETFVSVIDGSVQYYAVQPARPGRKGAPALVLTLHGASVEAIGQADAYGPKDWCQIVAPTNRRPYGFDWEDWGRLDAMEVLDLARARLHTDPRRTYLTGHSMGGHGTWHVGVTFPDRFAAIAPSAGWVSFASYAGGRPRPEHPTPVQEMLLRAGTPGETLTLSPNYARHGVYVLHGDADDNVPVGQARIMRRQLGAFHPDFAYYERPGAGHWWGGECVDWPPLFDFLARHTLPAASEMRPVDFVTASPGVSAWCGWAAVEAQQHALRPSTLHLRYDAGRRRFAGTTDNVARLALDVSAVPPGAPLHAEVDGQELGDLTYPAGKPARLWLTRADGRWAASAAAPATHKGPHRYGPFKEAFRDRMVFVYGTKGTAGENAWAFARARYDAETWWYRGNGAVDVVADADFDPAAEPDRGVVLYGHAEGNAAWKALLGAGPVQVRRGSVTVGDRTETGDDLACLFVRPRPGSDRALVAAVSGTGLAGLRLTDRVPYFVSGCGYPDCLVLGPETLTRGEDGVRAAGYFGNDWGVPTGEFVWGRPGR